MPIYKQTTEITNIDDLLSSVERDIEEVYFGDKQVFTVWGEYDGTLPATYIANGSTLGDYRVYGAAGGVGDRTENLFNPRATNINNGYVALRYLLPDGTEFSGAGSAYYFITEYTLIPSGTETLSLINNTSSSVTAICFYDANKTYISGVSNQSNPHGVVSCPAGAVYYRSSVERGKINIAMVVEGSTAPEEYVPYGYEVDMSVSDGTTSTTTPIYIGDEPLDAIGNYADYVDYHAGKIVRSVLNHVFTGTEPAWRALSTSIEMYASRVVPNIVFNSAVRSYSPDGDVLFQNISYGGGVSVIRVSVAGISSAADIMPYLKSLYDNGTPAVMRYASSVEQSQDPPVPLPTLPTVDGTTITDYVGESTAPSRFYAKYRKQNF